MTDDFDDEARRASVENIPIKNIAKTNNCHTTISFYSTDLFYQSGIFMHSSKIIFTRDTRREAFAKIYCMKLQLTTIFISLIFLNESNFSPKALKDVTLS